MTEPAPPSLPPLFVVGCGRSGSTLLRLMLDAHPELAVPGESHFIPELRRRHPDPIEVDEVTAELLRTPNFRHWKVSEHAVWDRVRAVDAPSFAHVVEAAFMANADEHGKTRWGDKTPIYVQHIPLLDTLWPDARFVHVIRDGRDVTLSYLSLHWGPSTAWAAARKWRRDVTAGIRHGQPLGTSRYLEVRYESLVRDPRATLEAVTAFAGLAFDERMLDPAAHPVRPDARDWRTQMEPDAVRHFEAIAGDQLHDLGYERRYPHVPSRDRVEGVVRSAGLDAKGLANEAKRAFLRRVHT
jgi:hypothetical protein